jgi:hypothetical protein
MGFGLHSRDLSANDFFSFNVYHWARATVAHQVILFLLTSSLDPCAI